jgi:hypothetical protein
VFKSICSVALIVSGKFTAEEALMEKLSVVAPASSIASLKMNSMKFYSVLGVQDFTVNLESTSTQLVISLETLIELGRVSLKKPPA